MKENEKRERKNCIHMRRLNVKCATGVGCLSFFHSWSNFLKWMNRIHRKSSSSWQLYFYVRSRERENAQRKRNENTLDVIFFSCVICLRKSWQYCRHRIPRRNARHDDGWHELGVIIIINFNDDDDAMSV